MAKLWQAASGLRRMEQLALGNSPLHRLHPMPKLLVTLCYVVAVASFPYDSVGALTPFAFYPAVLMSLSGTPFRPLMGRLLLALPFALPVGIANLCLMRSTAFFIGNAAISAGLVSFASILLKTLLCVWAVLLLTATASFADIGAQLSALCVPKIFCLTMMMTYRYLSVLMDEAATMYVSYTLRAPAQKGIRMRHMGVFAGQLILRSVDRAERVYRAMCCRGFQGVIQGGRRKPPRPSDWLYGLLLPLVIAAFRFFDISLIWGGWAG